MLESVSSLPWIFGHFNSTWDKETKNTAEHVTMEKIFIYARACVK